MMQQNNLRESPLQAVIFDLDGTLVDSAAAICENANVVMNELGLDELSVAETKTYIGHGSRRFLEQAMTARDQPVDSPDFEKAFGRLQEVYAGQPGEANRPFDGVQDVLAALHGRGIALGLCTNKPAAPTRQVVEAHGWVAMFGAVVAGDDLVQRKPDPTPLRTVIARLGVETAIYIGDSEVDALTAAAAEIPFVLFTEGYRKGPAADIKAQANFGRYDELDRVLARLVLS